MSAKRNSDEKNQRELAEPPDGGWGWVVMTSAFVVTLIMRGSEAAMAVVYVKFLDVFGAGGAVTSGIVSVFTAANFGGGALAAILTKKFGFRKVAMFGGMLSFLAFFASSFATGIVYLYISLGIVAGSSFGLVFMPTMVSLGRYFKNRYVLASSISLGGLGAGAFIMPPLCQFLLDHYGWRGTLMIFASISANMSVSAALLRPIHLQSSSPREGSKLQIVNDADGGVETNNGIENPAFGETMCMEENQKEGGECAKRSKPRGMKESKKSIKSTRKKKVTLGLCKETPLFIALLIYYALYNLGTAVVYTHLVDTAIRKGTSHVDAALLMSIMGIVTCISSIATGLLLDCCGLQSGRVYTHCFGVGMFAAATVAVPKTNSYPPLMAIASVMGVSRGMFSAVDYPCIKQIVGVERFAEGVGVAMIPVGIGFLIGPPLSGYFFDQTGSYNLSFYFAAGILTVGALAMVVSKWCADNSRKESRDINVPET
ncbi:monocarboxylate transporter 13-like [Glandiceps talaboti]